MREIKLTTWSMYGRMIRTVVPIYPSVSSIFVELINVKTYTANK